MSSSRGLMLALLAAGSALASAAPAREDDLWPQAVDFPDPSKIVFEWRGDGFTQVTGRPGAVGGGLPVMAVSPNNGYAARTVSGSDGSFTARVVAPPGSWVMVRHDPTAALLGGARWLTDFGAGAEAFQADHANAAPATWMRVPAAQSAGPGASFTLTDALEGGLDYTLQGALSGDLKPGGRVKVSGTVVVYPRPEAAQGLLGRSLALRARLDVLFDGQGRARMESADFFSSVLTPSGLPVAHPGFKHDAAPRIRTGPLRRRADGASLVADVELEYPIPASAPSGTYALWLGAEADETLSKAALPGPRGLRHGFPSKGMMPLPPFRLGRPRRPRLIWTLLTDVPSADGTRGAVAAEDEKSFQLVTHIATQARRYVVPRDSKKTGLPLTYRLEPYLPMVATGGRHVPYPPVIPFKFPSGRLTVRVTRPDGRVDALGPAPFKTARSRAPTTSAGLLLDNGGSNLVDVLQLSSDSRAFDYRFPSYGRYRIEMTGTVEDIYGNVYDGGGTYTVYVARPLNLQPAVLPMTPFQVGDSLNPGMTVLPGLPADIEVETVLYLDSDPGRAVRGRVAGRANRFGYFMPPPGESRPRMSGPGELLVEATARYVDANGELWMGTLRWGQVVETPGMPVLAHGRRGLDDTSLAPEERALWEDAPAKLGDPFHLQFPYMSGDVCWVTPDHAAIPIVTLQDREGEVTKSMRRLAREGRYFGTDYFWDIAFEDRLRMGELPLTLATRSGVAPNLAPGDIDVHGYWYAGVERPGVRVRENISDDRAMMTGYWFFNEIYELQPGGGAEGDLPGDFMFQFGGAVYRDARSKLSRYGIYGSLMVVIPKDEARGSRVFPPFEGANGGPSGGPLMTLAGKPIGAFVVPLAARPGTLLEAGDAFSLSAQLAPTLPGRVEAKVTGPGGFSRVITGRANRIGYFYDPGQDFALTVPGVYHVALTASFDVATSAGPAPRPAPTGRILGDADEGFDVYVVPSSGPLLGTDLPAWSAVEGVGPVDLRIRPPVEPGGGTLHYTIGMPGYQLRRARERATPSEARLLYEPAALHRSFPNIDVKSGRAGAGPGLADTVWVNALWEDARGRFYPRQFTLEGPDLHAP